MNDAIRRMITEVERQKTPTARSNNDFLDDVLDGKPYMHVDTAGFRRALRERAAERADEGVARRLARRLGINPERER